MFVLCFVLHCFVYSLISTDLDWEERAGCFTLFTFLVSCDCYVALPHGALGWYVVCDCGISWSY